MASWWGVLWLLLLLLVDKLFARAEVYLGPSRVAKSSVVGASGISLRIIGISVVLLGALRGTVLEMGVPVDGVVWVSVCLQS